MKINKKRGFTLFELLVSISIIGILTAIASVSFSTAQKKARDARRMEDVNAVAKAAESFYAVGGYTYPTELTVAAFTVNSEALLSVVPSDPKPSPYIQYSYQPNVPSVGGFCVCAYMENSVNANATAGNCTFAAGGYWYCIRNQQ